MKLKVFQNIHCDNDNTLIPSALNFAIIFSVHGIRWVKTEILIVSESLDVNEVDKLSIGYSTLETVIFLVNVVLMILKSWFVVGSVDWIYFSW